MRFLTARVTWISTIFIFFATCKLNAEDLHPKMISIVGGNVVVYPSKVSEPETVSVKSFSIAQTETTVGEFKLFLEDSEYQLSSDKCNAFLGGKLHVNWDKPGFQQDDSHPIVCVSWYDVQAYLEWLTEKTSVKYRLPSIAEWNLAFVRGNSLENFFEDRCSQNIGDSTILREFISELKSGARPYPFLEADEESKRRYEEGITDIWESCSDGYASTSPVKRFSADGSGLFGMIGNVLEWAEDCYFDGKRTRTTTSPTGKVICEPRATKGTGFVSAIKLDGEFNTTSLHTTIGAISAQYAHIGFRIAKDIDE